MNQHPPTETPAGTILEFFESREILCGVSLSTKNSRLTLLTEQNREINLAQSRVIHAGSQPLNAKLSRDELVRKLVTVAAVRRSLMQEVNIEELWSLVQGEEEGLTARDAAEFIFSDAVTDNHVAAAQRALLQDRTFFQFKDGKFFPRSEEKVEQRRLEIQREEEKEARLEAGSQWLQAIWNRKGRGDAGINAPWPSLIEDLKAFCLFNQDAASYPFLKELFKRTSVPPLPQSAFRILLRLGIWHENENLYLLEQNISPEFSKEIEDLANDLSAADIHSLGDREQRRDLRSLHTFTIDGAQTRDYDDALSLEILEDGLFEIGIHIADAAEFVAKGSPLDLDAQERASSIYLPDARISMLPPALSEGICSLKAGEDRLALSFLLRMDAGGEIQSREIVSSIIKIKEQLTYQEVNERIQKEPFHTLHALASKLKEQRLARGAVILPLPEIQVFVGPMGMIQVYRYEKETPSQLIVSEWMIAANGTAAAHLAENGVPSLYRLQGECKPETDFTQSEHEIYRIYRQRRLFARAELDTKPGAHCSLGMPQYTTATSPIRRYSDLVVQRQLKHLLTYESPLYSEDELRQVMMKLGLMQSKISLIQRKWTRYWILKYMEQEDFQILNALVLDLNGRFAHLLIPDFLMETNVPILENVRLQRGEMIRVKIEKLNPREDILRVQLPDFTK